MKRDINTRISTPSKAKGEDNGASTGRLVTASVVGTIFEFFDLILFGLVSALVFTDLFFPQENEFVSTVFVWGTFAAGYLVRPLGAAIFGPYGDRVGRKKVLSITLAMMGGATVLMGLLPTYHQIGIAAPIILISLRLLSGIAAGGEHGAATLLLTEHRRNSKHKNFLASLPTAGSVVGSLLATATVSFLTFILTTEQFAAWGWRIPFIASVGVVILGIFVRRKVEEPPVFRELKETREVEGNPLVSLVRKAPKQLLIAAAPIFGIFFIYYVVILVTVPYAASFGNATESFLLLMVTIGQIVYAVTIPSAAALADKFGRRRLMQIGAIAVGVWAFIFPMLVTSESSWAIVVAYLGLFVANGFVYGPVPAYMSDQFEPEVRLTGMSLTYQLGGAIAGGFAPLIATTLLVSFGNSWTPVAVTFALMAIITVVATSFSRELRPEKIQDDGHTSVQAYVADHS